jgi:hypothetical protein
MTDIIERAFNDSVEKAARASVDIFAWSTRAASVVASALKAEHDELDLAKTATHVHEQLTSKLDLLRRGGYPMKDQKGRTVMAPPMSDVLLAEGLANGLGDMLAQQTANSISKQAFTVFSKARRERDEKLKGLMAEYHAGERNAHLYDQPQLELKAEPLPDPIAEIDRREKALSKYPAKRSK